MGKVFKKDVLLWPLPQLADAFKGPDLKAPSAPPPAPTILTEPVEATAEKKRTKSGRIATQIRNPGDLSDASIFKPTLLGQ